jgi:hypothetical protein
MNWKKSLIFCISFIVCFFAELAINLACGPEQDPYDYFVSYFHNNVQGDRYTGFSFNNMVFLYDSETIADETEINSAEWATYLQVEKNDVHRLMYEVDSLTNLKLHALKEYQLKDFSPAWQKNSYLKALFSNEKAKKYFELAKSCEPFVIGDYDSWDPVARDSTMMIKKAIATTKMANAEIDKFLKLRYGYQVVRLYHYAKNAEACKTAYETLVKPIKLNSAAQGWALSAYAGALRSTGYPVEAAYFFSKVFATNPERRIQAYRNYFYIDTTASAVAKLAKTNEEKANIWAIQGFGTPEPNLTPLLKVYQYQPKSEMVGTLLVREVNKLEESLIKDSGLKNVAYTAYFGGSMEEIASRKKNLAHLFAVRDFALHLAKEKKYIDPQLGTLAASYLSWVAHDDVRALALLKQLNPGKLAGRFKDQYRIIELLIKVNAIKKGGFLKENELLPALKWLDYKRYEEQKSARVDSNNFSYLPDSEISRFAKTARNLYQQILAPAYLKRGDTAKAALAMLKGDQDYRPKGTLNYTDYSYATSTFWQEALGPKTMLKLANLKSKPKQNNFEGFLAYNLNYINNDDFYELFGTTLLRSHDYNKAIWCFEKIKNPKAYFQASNYWQSNSELHGNPFVETINDYPKRYEGNKLNNKLTFAKAMSRLQKLIISNRKNAAQYYYEMANAIYQTGHYGNSWFLVSYHWSSYENDEKPTYFYHFDYKQARTAKNWYLKAKALSNDSDFRAKCTFMLAKCEQKKMTNNLFANSDGGWYSQEDHINYLNMNMRNPYFKELKSNYTKTKFFKTAVGECSYLKDFITGKKFVIEKN